MTYAVSVDMTVPPAACARRAFHRQQKQARRHDHPPESGSKGKSRPARITQFSKHEFALRFEGDDEEEERHKTVVDPVLQRADEFYTT